MGSTGYAVRSSPGRLRRVRRHGSERPQISRKFIVGCRSLLQDSKRGAVASPQFGTDRLWLRGARDFGGSLGSFLGNVVTDKGKASGWYPLVRGATGYLPHYAISWLRACRLQAAGRHAPARDRKWPPCKARTHSTTTASAALIVLHAACSSTGPCLAVTCQWHMRGSWLLGEDAQG